MQGREDGRESKVENRVGTARESRNRGIENWEGNKGREGGREGGKVNVRDIQRGTGSQGGRASRAAGTQGARVDRAQGDRAQGKILMPG